MRKLFVSITFLGLFLLFGTQGYAQNTDPFQKIKTHLNEVVKDIHQTTEPELKREKLDTELTGLISTISKVENMDGIHDTDRDNLSDLRTDLQNKKDELNGENGYARVPSNQLNDYATFVQQDLEQADSVVTLSLSTALLIVIILLLL